MTHQPHRRAMVCLWTQRICRWGVAGVLLAAAAIKLMDLEAFAATIGDFGLVWPDWERASAILVVFLEAAAGGLLFARRRLGYYLAATLLVGFTAVIGYGLWLGLDIDCGCLGPADRWTGSTLQASFWRNVILLVALAFAWRQERGGD